MTVNGGWQAAGRNSDLWRGTYREGSFLAVVEASCGTSLLKDCTCLRGAQTEAFHKGLSPMEGLHAGAQEEHEEERVEKM